MIKSRCGVEEVGSTGYSEIPLLKVAVVLLLKKELSGPSSQPIPEPCGQLVSSAGEVSEDRFET